MERELPELNIEGTDFLVDVQKLELREKANPENIIAFEEMRDFFDGYSFQYSKAEKNIPSTFSEDTLTVTIPAFVKLDPAGMAVKYNMADLTGKTDFEVMVNQEAFDRRVNKGELPTMDIAGHTFYVDLRMDKLRPHDDFISKGIVFEEIDHYYSDEINAYIIPYNPKTHEFQELNYEKISAFPKDLIAVQFPSQRNLDPIGWNRLGGWELEDGLKQTGLKSHFKAETIPWDQTWLKEIIKINYKDQNKQPKNSNRLSAQLPPKPTKGKGRKM
ncbi:hypothetical protein [Pedobacter agri]|uniref:hypothetical protein n=1 Tax=Pedobacter agri TaxID=454586 RepID=UPI002931B846|nr:hypothetical protein [Pedobacter agri]